MEYGASEKGRDLPSITGWKVFRDTTANCCIQKAQLYQQEHDDRNIQQAMCPVVPRRGYKFILQLLSPKAVSHWIGSGSGSMIWEQSGLAMAEPNPLGKISCKVLRWPRLIVPFSGNSHSDPIVAARGSELYQLDSPAGNATLCKRKETAAKELKHVTVHKAPQPRWPHVAQKPSGPWFLRLFKGQLAGKGRSNTSCKHNTQAVPGGGQWLF